LLLEDLSKQELELGLRKRLERVLPGEEGQYLMAPSERRSLPMDRPDARQAAVLCLIYPNQERWSVLLMKRRSYPGVHSDQISFPGGQVEEGDADLLDTALRETEEEMGIRIHREDTLSPLTKLYIPPSNFMVHPFLGLIDHRPPIDPQDEEVDEVIEAELLPFLNGSIQGHKMIRTSYGEYEVPVYNYNGHNIWGATAMMLSEMTVLIRESLEFDYL
jgi:8-oxo-dGTP pyrophosphatase MutT (NUDIX family)